MSTVPRWAFRPMGRAEMNADPVHEEFFSTEALDSLSAGLVREFIQNALDAREGGPPVQVRFVFGNNGGELDTETAAPYLEGLWEHLQARGAGIRREDMPCPGDRMGFLAMEDFGTRGLQGDPRQDDEGSDAARGKRNDFYYFWRNLGRSGKGDRERGRWGLGHTIFAAASRVNSFLGMTLRRDDCRVLLMGQSVLKTHWVDGKKYCPYGYFGVFSNDYFAMPVENERLARRFCQDFGLKRLQRPGLSVVVPFPDTTIDEESIAREVISHYFYPILTGDLVAELASGGSSYVLDQSTLRDIAGRVFGTKDRQKIESLSKLFDLVEWSGRLKTEDFARPEVVPLGRPSWEGIKFSKATLDSLRDAYEANKRVALQIPVAVHESNGRRQEASFRLFMHRDPELRRGEVYFVRQGITILNPNAPRERFVRALVVIEDPALSKLLGDAENPAHTEWQERSEKFRGKYEYGPSCLRFVKRAVAEVVRILSAPSEERDRNLLKDVFFVPRRKEEGDLGAKPTEGTDETKSGGADVGGVGKKLQAIRVERVAHGFKVSADPEADDRKRLVTVRLAYAVRRGDPLKRYVPEDFRLDSNDIHVRHQDVNIRELVENRLVFETRSKAFFVEIGGFDAHRDLVIQLTHEDLDS